MPKKKKPPAKTSAQMRWEFDSDIPTHDFFESGSLDDMWNLQEAVDSFVHWMEEDRFLTWEAVACEEQAIPLTPRQKKALGGLLNFNDEEDDGILYIDEMPRRDRISAISSISVSPRNRALNLHFDLLPDNANVHGEDVVEYLRHLKAQLRGPLTILWDGSRVHDRSQAVQAFLAQHPEIHTERLPAYAPELNPDELVWAWTKYSRLGNLAAQNTDWLRDYIITELT